MDLGRVARVKLSGTSKLMFGGFVSAPKLPGEDAQAYEERTWPQRMKRTKEGQIYIPGLAAKRMLESTAKYMSIPVPGKARETYTKYFTRGLRTKGDILVLGDWDEDADHAKLQSVGCAEWHHVPSDGKQGGGKRVLKCFPIMDPWEALVEFVIVEPKLTNEVFEQHLINAGISNGLGVWRPQLGGSNGTFVVDSIEWSQLTME